MRYILHNISSSSIETIYKTPLNTIIFIQNLLQNTLCSQNIFVVAYARRSNALLRHRSPRSGRFAPKGPLERGKGYIYLQSTLHLYLDLLLTYILHLHLYLRWASIYFYEATNCYLVNKSISRYSSTRQQSVTSYGIVSLFPLRVATYYFTVGQHLSHCLYNISSSSNIKYYSVCKFLDYYY